MDLTKKHPGRGRAIVNPELWDKSEVSNVAEAKMQSNSSSGGRGSARVTSMRSSLFMKAANTASTRDGDVSDNIFCDETSKSEIDIPIGFLECLSLNFCEFGLMNSSTWTTDIFALVHNGIRCELKDMGICLQAVRNIGEKLKVKDCIDLNRWWQVFAEIMIDFIALEEIVIVPWISDALPNSESSADVSVLLQEGRLRLNEISDQIHKISKLLQMVCGDQKAMSSVSMQQRQNYFIEAFCLMTHLGSSISEYMHNEENQYSSFLSSHYLSEKIERENILDAIFQLMMSEKAQRLSEFLVLQTRWMSDPKQQRSHTKYLLSLHNWSLSKLHAQYEMLHTGIVAVFKVKGAC